MAAYPAYVRRINDELTDTRAELDALKEKINELVFYFASAKFHNDPTVQINDVLTRLGTR